MSIRVTDLVLEFPIRNRKIIAIDLVGPRRHWPARLFPSRRAMNDARGHRQAPSRLLTWGDFAKAEPELAAFGAGRLDVPPAYLATVRRTGAPRLHPVTPIITGEGLFVFMEPTSPKGRDLRERGWYALHNGVPDTEGSGGEFSVSGMGLAVDDAGIWAVVAEAASYDPAEEYVLFQLMVGEARCNGYGDVPLPATRRWSAVSRP